MPLLKRCCCFFPLRKAAVTLGVIEFTGSITSLITLIIVRIFIVDVANGVMNLVKSRIDVPDMMGTRHLTENDREVEEQKLIDLGVYVYSILFIICFVGMIISCISSGLMVYGCVKNRRMLIVPWLVLGAINIIVLIVCFVVNIMAFIQSPYSLIVVFLGLQLGFVIYFWLIVLSFYQELRDRERLELGRPSELKRLNQNY